MHPVLAAGSDALSAGVRLRITADQVKEHCLERAQHHEKRAHWYADEASKLKGSVEAATEEAEDRGELGYSQMTKAQNPLGDLRSSARFHTNRAAWFRCVATYVEPNAVFTLSLHDAGGLDLPEAFKR